MIWALHGGVLARLAGLPPIAPSSPDPQQYTDLAQNNPDFLSHHGLALCWLQYLRHAAEGAEGAAGSAGPESPAVPANMVRLERDLLALYLAQSRAIAQLTQSFEQTGVGYALFKGAAWRDELYDQPHVRSATDIDVLVDQSDLSGCRAQLAALGFTRATNGSRGHEETWVRGSVDIDLHWHVLAPGRMPQGTARELIGRRVKTPAGFWRLRDEDMVAVALMHLAVSKYVCSQHAGLNRVLDLLLAIRRLDIQWPQVVAAIRAARLGGAAWASLSWINCLLAAAPTYRVAGFPDGFEAAIRPGQWRARYLRFWIRHDLPGRLEPRAAWLVSMAFTLPMHDSLTSALEAARHRLRRRAA